MRIIKATLFSTHLGVSVENGIVSQDRALVDEKESQSGAETKLARTGRGYVNEHLHWISGVRL